MKKPFSITTKTGDQGRTRLFSCECVWKSSPRLDAYGDIDELACILGIARFYVQPSDLKVDLLYIQRALSTVAAELATTKKKLNKLPQRLDENMLAVLEDKRQTLEAKTSIPKGFVVSGDCLPAAYLDFARTVARRCERKAAGLFEDRHIDNKILIVWLNRLSDYLYLMARFIEKKPTLVNPSTGSGP